MCTLIWGAVSVIVKDESELFIFRFKFQYIFKIIVNECDLCVEQHTIYIEVNFHCRFCCELKLTKLTSAVVSAS